MTTDCGGWGGGKAWGCETGELVDEFLSRLPIAWTMTERNRRRVRLVGEEAAGVGVTVLRQERGSSVQVGGSRWPWMVTEFAVKWAAQPVLQCSPIESKDWLTRKGRGGQLVLLGVGLARRGQPHWWRTW